MQNNVLKEEHDFRSRLEDQAAQADRRSVPVFTDFLDLNEQNIFHTMEKQLSFTRPVLFGGYAFAERQMLVFLPDALSFMAEEVMPDTQPDRRLSPDRQSHLLRSDRLPYSEHQSSPDRQPYPDNQPSPDRQPLQLQQIFPIRCIRIALLDRRFTQPPSHRDYLGSVTGLGIDRRKTGDILVDEGGAWLFCHASVADYICAELRKVKHTSVECTLAEGEERQLPEPKTERVEGSIPSPRLDALIALAFRASRSSLKELPASGKVFINGKLTMDPGARVSEGDIVSVRGSGRFRYCGEQGRSKKGRLFAAVERFI